MNDDLLMMNGESGRFISLNETGAYLWARLAEPNSADSLADALCAEFEVVPTMARADVDAWLDAMQAEQAVEEDAG